MQKIRKKAEKYLHVSSLFFINKISWKKGDKLYIYNEQTKEIQKEYFLFLNETLEKTLRLKNFEITFLKQLYKESNSF